MVPAVHSADNHVPDTPIVIAWPSRRQRLELPAHVYQARRGTPKSRSADRMAIHASVRSQWATGHPLFGVSQTGDGATKLIDRPALHGDFEQPLELLHVLDPLQCDLELARCRIPEANGQSMKYKLAGTTLLAFLDDLLIKR
jgi:hypothetical protein